MNLDNHILKVLTTSPGSGRPVTLGDLARELGVSPALVLPAARRLVDSGQAVPVLIDVHGVPTLRALRPVAPVQADAATG